MLKKTSASILLALGISALPVAAQDFPSGTITLVVPYGVGGDTDLHARLVAEELAPLLDATVIVENRPGGSATIGTTYVKNQPANGHTILVTTTAYVTAYNFFNDPGYEPSDFTLLSVLSTDMNVLLTTDTFPADTLAEYVDYGKANPGAMNYGSLGAGGDVNMLSVRFAKLADFEWLAIPYEGDQQALMALLRGEIDGYFGGPSTSIPLDAGSEIDGPLPSLKFLAVAGESRSRFLPDVPTFTELGYPEMVEANWIGVHVRSDTPPEIVARLREVMAEVTNSPRLQEALVTMNLEPYPGTLEQAEAMIEAKGVRVREHMQAYGVEKQ